MAKALLGHVGVGSDARLVAEVTRLRRRVRDLEDELARSAAVNDAIREARRAADEMALLEPHVDGLREPALA